MDVNTAHKFCSNHRAQLDASSICGCFYCLETFSPAAIVEWVDDEKTALCPKCHIDSAIGSESGAPLTNDFLKQMHERWF